MLILQLFIFALAFIGLGIFLLIKRKKFLAYTFILMGTMLLVIAIVVVSFYPHTLPFRF